MSILDVRTLMLNHAHHCVIQPFSWQVRAGEKWAVLGANGAGKSSLLHALLGVDHAASSHIFLDNQAINQTSAMAQAKRRVWVAQRYDEPFTITVRQAFDSIQHHLPHHLAEQHLADFGLIKHQNAWVHQLSGGERQRLTWAMAAARHTDQTGLWLLDEPLSAQDLAWQNRLLHYLDKLPCAVVAALHDLNQVQQFATHVLVLIQNTRGSVVQYGSVQEIMQPELLQRVYGVPLQQEKSYSGASWWRV